MILKMHFLKTDCRTLQLFLLLLLSTSPAIYASDPHKLIKQSLVYVVAQAIQSVESITPGIPVSSQSTGFFIDPTGYVVTSHHLITSLGKIDSKTLKIRVHTERFSTLEFPADIDFKDAQHDILILKIPTVGETYIFMPVLARPRRHTDPSTVLFTSGFSSVIPYKFSDGKVTSFDGPAGNQYLWVTTLGFENGQSGSPIYLDNGLLVGIAKGQQRNNILNNFVVPTRYIPPAYIHTSTSDINDIRIAEAFQINSAVGRPDNAKNLGTIQIMGYLPNDTDSIIKSRNSLKDSIRMTNKFCSGERAITQTIAPTVGWSIEPESVAVNVTRTSGQSTFLGHSLDTLENGTVGIRLEGKLKNSGDCIQAFGKTVALDEIGFLNLEVSYDEVIYETPEQTIVGETSVYEGIPVNLFLPENTSGLETIYTDNLGNASVVLDESIPGFRLNINEELRQVTAEPQ